MSNAMASHDYIIVGGGSAAWLAMALGVIALGAVAGARTATGRSR